MVLDEIFFIGVIVVFCSKFFVILLVSRIVGVLVIKAKLGQNFFYIIKNR